MTMTLDGSGANTVGVPNAKTAQNATGTAIDFTGIPAGTKRITVMLSGVSLSGGTNALVQIGSGSVTTTGYLAMGNQISTAAAGGATSTIGFPFGNNSAAADAFYGFCTIVNVSGNVWVCNGSVYQTSDTRVQFTSGGVTLGGTLDRVRITNTGADTFDAGTINILYE